MLSHGVQQPDPASHTASLSGMHTLQAEDVARRTEAWVPDTRQSGTFSQGSNRTSDVALRRSQDAGMGPVQVTCDRSDGTASIGESAARPQVEQARIGELQPRQVTLKPLPKYLFQPQPTIVATTAVNRAAAQDSAFPDPLAAKRKLGQRPRTTHEHFEVRVQWSMQQSDEKHISAKVATDSTTSASCEDSQPRCCGDESLRRTAEQYHLANSLMQPEEPSASADGDATHASAPDSPNHDPTVRSDAEDSGAPCENAGKRRLVPAGAHDTAGKRQKGEAANAQQSSDTAFKGDSQATQAALVEIRKHFRDNATASESAIPKLVADGHEALSFLRDAVLQGQLNERGNYAVSGLPEQEVVNILDPTEVKFKQPPNDSKS